MAHLEDGKILQAPRRDLVVPHLPGNINLGPPVPGRLDEVPAAAPHTARRGTCRGGRPQTFTALTWKISFTSGIPRDGPGAGHSPMRPKPRAAPGFCKG